MRTFRVAVVLVGLLVAGLVLPTPSEAAVPSWTTVPLRPLVTGESSRVRAINNAGVSVGSSGTTPVRWDATGTPTALPIPTGCTAGFVRSISEGGVMLGNVTCGGLARGVEWLPSGTPVDLPYGFFASDYDDASGVLVGTASPGDGTGNAAVYVQGQPTIYLFDGDAGDSFAHGVQAHGYVVGTLLTVPSVGNPGYQIATGWYGTAVFPLVSPGIDSSAVDLNEAGYALVQISEPGYQRGVLVSPRGALTAIENGGRSDDVFDLNNWGGVVGSRVDTSGTSIFGLIYLGGGSIRLDGLASPADNATFEFRHPVGINDNAWVVGNKQGANQSSYTAWLLRPPTG